MKRSRIFQLGFALIILGAIIVVSACEKHVTPNKVENKITKDSWMIGSFNFMDSSITTSFANLTFGFGETGNIRIVEDANVNGNWIVGESKDPTVLYISSFVDSPYVFLNDNWTVVTVSKHAFNLESQNGAYLNEVNFTKIED